MEYRMHQKYPHYLLLITHQQFKVVLQYFMCLLSLYMTFLKYIYSLSFIWLEIICESYAKLQHATCRFWAFYPHLRENSIYFIF